MCKGGIYQKMEKKLMLNHQGKWNHSGSKSKGKNGL